MWQNLVIHEWQAVFFVPPKVAGSSIKAALCEALGRSTHPDRIHRDWEVYGPGEIANRFPSYRKVGFVRNPYDRLVSCWYQKLRGRGTNRMRELGFWHGMDFADFAERVCEIPDSRADHHFRSQAYMMVAGDLVPDTLCRFETLADDWEALREDFPLPELAHRNGSSHEDFRSYYDQRLADMVGERYAEDLRVFGYSRL